MRKRLFSTVLALAVSGCATAGAVPPSGAGFWKLLDTRKVGAASFLKRNPEWDGRGAVVAVLDTGVDMGVAGLQKTSDGKVKVIEARDFSGQGDIALSPAELKTIDGARYLSSEEGKVRGFDALPIKADSKGWQLGFLDESRFQNSEVPDLNRNGSTSDRFAVLTVIGDNDTVAYVDRDGNGDFTGETPIHSYHRKHQGFTFRLPDPENQRAPVTFALHVEEDGSLVGFHYDDGGHGTHVAGIATGNDLMGREGFDGVAPGAQVMSLKIGDNTLSGGATTSESMFRAIEFAGSWSSKHSRPVIINLSYGIGSEIEGESDIDNVLDDALARHPLLSAAVSAGNEGPGLSTVGIPAASHLCTSVAAMLPKETGRALFGASIGRDMIFGFSSRGGELAKPDLLAPGVASSSVPAFDHGDVKGGTSMAAPQIAGVYALLASAAVATKTRYSGATLKRALLHSATPLGGYLPVEQGAGVPDVGRAFDTVRKLGKHKEPFLVAGYAVSTTVPTSHSGVGPAGYWRAGTYLPGAADGQGFDVEPRFRPDATGKDRAAFQTILDFDSKTSWIDVDRSSGRIVGENALSVTVTYDPSKLKEPGVYTGRVAVVPDDGAKIPATWLWTTVVTPHTFSLQNRYSMDHRSSLAPGEIRRYPVLVPPGATSMSVRIATPKGKWGSTMLYVYDPDGHAWPVDSYRASTDDDTEARVRVKGEQLQPGIWELIAYGSFRNRKTTHYGLAVRFRGMAAPPITRYNAVPGKNPTGRFSVVNRYDTRFRGPVSGGLNGFRRKHRVKVEGDTHSATYHMNDEVERIDLVLRLDPRTYNRFTDVAVSVLDASQAAVVKDGFVSGVVRVSIPKSAGDSPTLEIQGAFAKQSDEPWTVSIEETFVWAKSIGAMVDHDVVLYPNVKEHLSFNLSSTPPKPPPGYESWGEITFKDRKTDEVWLTVPMRFK